MKYDKHIKAFNNDLKEFIETSGYLIEESPVGRAVIAERITRLYKQLTDPNTPPSQLIFCYKLIASYAVMGMIAQMKQAVSEPVKGIAHNAVDPIPPILPNQTLC